MSAPEVDPNEHVRVLHEVFYSSGNFVQSSLSNACAKAESQGMMLLNVIDSGLGYSVAVFIGAENFAYSYCGEESP